MRRPLLVPLALALGTLAASCTSDGEPAPDPSAAQGTQVSVALATSDHYAGAPQRISAGLVLPDNRLVSFGSVDFAFSYRGTADAPVAAEPGPSATAVYVPTPGTPDEASGPVVTLPSEARGVYQAEDVTFDRAGFWQLDVTADVQGLGVRRSKTTVTVLDHAAYPAPGDPAPHTENLTVDSPDAPPEAIDSRAANGGRIPDLDLHRWTIADAIAQGRPALVVFSTPVYCVSQFCGPVTDLVEDLASRYDDRAVFIHVEIWRDYQNQVINQAAADWLLRGNNLTEPWVYLIGPDGTILDRWATLFRQDEVAAELRSLPKMK